MIKRNGNCARACVCVCVYMCVTVWMCSSFGVAIGNVVGVRYLVLFAPIFHDYLSNYFLFWPKLLFYIYSAIKNYLPAQYASKKQLSNTSNWERKSILANTRSFSAWESQAGIIPWKHTHTHPTHTFFVYTLRLVCVSNKHNRVIKCKRSIVLIVIFDTVLFGVL